MYLNFKIQNCFRKYILMCTRLNPVVLFIFLNIMIFTYIHVKQFLTSMKQDKQIIC